MAEEGGRMGMAVEEGGWQWRDGGVRGGGCGGGGGVGELEVERWREGDGRGGWGGGGGARRHQSSSPCSRPPKLNNPTSVDSFTASDLVKDFTEEQSQQCPELH